MSNDEKPTIPDLLADLKAQGLLKKAEDESGVIRLAEHKKNKDRDDKAVRCKEMADSFLARHYESFRVIVDQNGTLSCAEVTSPGVLRPVEDRYIMNKMMRHLMGQAVYPDVKNNVFPLWLVLSASQTGIRSREIVPLVFKSDTTTPWAWQRLNFDPTEIEIPDLLTKMLARTSPDEGRSLVLWLGSLLDYEFPRSQYLYLHGDGNDGKSTLIAMLIKLLGTQGVAMMRSDDFSDSHSTTVLEGARLAIFADENSASFMSRGRFKALTGDDTLTVNPKGQARRNIGLHCKVMVASNYAPHLQGGRADLRRIIPVKLSPIAASESSHAQGLAFVEQGPAIMQFCYTAFKAWQAAHPDKMIPAGDAAIAEVEADSMQSDTESEVLGALRFGPEYSVSAATLNAYLRPRFGNRAGLQHVYQVMKRHGARRAQATINGGRTWVWTGVGIIPHTT